MKHAKLVTFLSAIGILLIIIILVYFKPINLYRNMEENKSFTISKTEHIIKNSVPDMKLVSYDNITDEQKNKVIDILKQYTYKKNFTTLFSSIFSDHFINLFTNGDSIFSNIELNIYTNFTDKEDYTFTITDSNQVIINNKKYTLQNSKRLIEQIEQIFNS